MKTPSPEKNEWTKVAPTIPGWYWWRKDAPKITMHVFLQRGLLVAATKPIALIVNDIGGEWWSERIQEPPVDRVGQQLRGKAK